MGYAVLWRFNWKNDNKPVIEICAESEDIKAVIFMIGLCLRYINVAERYGGIPSSEEPEETENDAPITVMFSLNFPTFCQGTEFLRHVQKYGAN